MKIGDVGARIREKRKEKKLTQAQLATVIGKTESSIRKYEKNLVEIPNEVMKKIATALDTTVSYLDGIDGIQKSFKEIEAEFTLLEKHGFEVFLDETVDEDGNYTNCNVIITFEGKEYIIKSKDYDACLKDINKYIKFRMLELINQ